MAVSLLGGIRLISAGKVVSDTATGGGTMESIVRSARHRVQLRLELGIPLHRAKMPQIWKIAGAEGRAYRPVSVRLPPSMWSPEALFWEAGRNPVAVE